MKDTNSENYNILLIEIKEDLNKWEVILCSVLRRVIMLRYPHIDLKVLSQSKYQHSFFFFGRIWQADFEIHVNVHDI